jgi:hypothetical protein
LGTISGASANDRLPPGADLLRSTKRQISTTNAPTAFANRTRTGKPSGPGQNVRTPFESRIFESLSPPSLLNLVRRRRGDIAMLGDTESSVRWPTLITQIRIRAQRVRELAHDFEYNEEVEQYLLDYAAELDVKANILENDAAPQG